jgi:pilus assembly protein CpaF
MDVDVLIQTEDGASHVRRFTLDGTPLSIGRTAECMLHLPSDCVSRLHAIVYVDQQGLRVEDRSSNGTFVGEHHLHNDSMNVPFGTLLVVGEYALALGPPGTLTPPDANNATAGLPPRPHNPLAVTGAQPVFEHAAPASITMAAPHSEIHINMPPGSSSPSGMAPSVGIAPVPTTTSIGIAPPAPGSNRSLGPPPSAPAYRPGPNSPLATASKGAKRKQEVILRREIHAKLLENLDLAKLDAGKLDDPSMRPRVLTALRRLVTQMDARIDPAIDRNGLVGELADEALGLGPLERFLDDPNISEVMVIDADTIYVESGGRLVLTDSRFTDDERVRAVIERIITPLGRRIDESSPLVDARLKDGSRVNAIIKPLALRGACITIRKFARVPLTVEKLISYGSFTHSMARFLARCVIARKNILISGGTGSGKTTLLNVLSGRIPEDERIVTIEDAAELQLPQPHVVPLESRPPNMEGRGEYTIRDLVKNALRMRPDRIVVGECRGGEALDMLQAMNTGHDGSLTTTHANSPAEALSRLETLALMAGLDLPSRAIREQIGSSIHVVVQVARLSDGSRRVTAISEVIGIDDDGQIEVQDIFEFVRTGTADDGTVLGEHRASGYLPSFLDEFIVAGLIGQGEPYL